MAPMERRKSINLEIERLPFYHDIEEVDTREGVKKILGKFINQNGYYLLRRSTTEPDVYTFSVTHDKRVLHVKVYQDSLCRVFLDVDRSIQPFANINDLVAYYKHKNIPNESEENMKFIYPVISTKTLKRRSGDSTSSQIFSSSRSSSMSDFNTDCFYPPRPLPPTPDEYAEKNNNEEKFCSCGLEINCSKLPNFWRVHVSHDEDTEGTVFFQNDDGRKEWELPHEIVMLLTIEQKTLLQTLKYQGNLQ